MGARQDRYKQQFDDVYKDYADYRDTYGSTPTDSELSTMLQGRRWGVQSAVLKGQDKHRARTQTVFGMGGSLFGDIDRQTREALEKHYQEDATRIGTNAYNTAQQRARNFSTGTLNDTNSYSYNGNRIAKQDLTALGNLLKDDDTPDRNDKISSFLKDKMGIELSANGTLSDRLLEYLGREYETKDAEGNVTQTDNKLKNNIDALGAILSQAGVTQDDEGNLVFPQKMTAEDIEKRLDQQRAYREQFSARMQDAELQRQRNRLSLAAFGSLVGDAIQARNGAKVMPRDVTTAYDSLNKQQKDIYDTYLARMDALRKQIQDREDTRKTLAAQQAIKQMEEEGKNRRFLLEQQGKMQAEKAKNQTALEVAKIKANAEKAVQGLKANGTPIDLNVSWISDFNGKGYLTKQNQSNKIGALYNIVKKYIPQTELLSRISTPSNNPNDIGFSLGSSGSESYSWRNPTLEFQTQKVMEYIDYVYNNNDQKQIYKILTGNDAGLRIFMNEQQRKEAESHLSAINQLYSYSIPSYYN